MRSIINSIAILTEDRDLLKKSEFVREVNLTFVVGWVTQLEGPGFGGESSQRVKAINLINDVTTSLPMIAEG